MRKHEVALVGFLAGSLSTCWLIVNPNLSVATAETPPFKLTIRADKETYEEGDRILLIYTIQNTSSEPVGYFDGWSLDIRAINNAGEPFRSHTYSYQSGMPGLGEYLLLEAGQQREGQEMFGRVVFDEVKDVKIQMGKPMAVAPAFEYDGLMLSQGHTQLFLSEPFDGTVRISATYCTSDPNPYKIIKENCEKQSSKSWDEMFSHKPFADHDPLDMDRAMYCQEYEKRTRKAFVGCLESNGIEIRIQRPSAQEGIVKAWYEDGKLRAEREYKDGQLQKITYYYPNGKVQGIRSYHEGKLTGLAKDFAEDGQVQHEWTFENGKLNGTSKSYFKNGKLLAETDFHNGELHGNVRQYLEDETLQYAATFKDGKRHGTETYHYPANWPLTLDAEEAGYTKVEGTYQDGKMNGMFRTYYTNETLASESRYENDKLEYIKEYDAVGNVVFDYDYTCEAGQPDATSYTRVPMEAKMVLEKVEVNEDGVWITIKDTFTQRYQSSPVYLSKYVEGNRVFIPRGADLRQFRSEEMPEPDDLKPYAFLAAWREDNQAATPYMLYLGKIEGDRISLLVRHGRGSSYVYIDKRFEAVKKCKGSAE
jgi:antitoxin component YwqK of YwqJK toxin-antitoxin module